MEKTATKKARLSRTRKPESMTVEQWQMQLRVQYGEDQQFEMQNIGDHDVFSEFMVTNPLSSKSYRVAVRGERPGVNYCSCPDFSVNTLGICKHIAFVLAKLRENTKTNRLLQQPWHPPFSELYLEYGRGRRVVYRPGMDAPKAIRKSINLYIDEENYVTDHGLRCFDSLLRRAGKSGHEVRCYDDVIEYVSHVRDAARRKKIIDKKYPKSKDTSRMRISGVHADLHPYQYEGAIFAARAGRSIIADEMGLGKTLQAITASLIMGREFGVASVLVVCPASVKGQWKREIERFTDLSASLVEGAAYNRRPIYNAATFFKIANYEQVYRDIEAINMSDIDMVILDETQRIKNWQTRTAKSIKQLKAPYAIALTGTPLENRIEELHSIVEFVDRYHLGPLFRFLHDHQLTDDTGKVVGYKNLSKISKGLKTILLRRAKKQVQQQLPERIDKNLYVGMGTLQAEYHEENRLIVAKLANKWRRFHFLTEQEQLRLRIGLQNMRMAADNAYLLDKENVEGPKTDELITVLEDVLAIPDEKVVIFSQWTVMQQLIARELEKNKIGYRFLHGGVPSPKRGKLIEEFHDDPDIRVFLSTDAGGTGLNLQRASVVINVDLPWNPAVLEQRIGRVHRIGQYRTVRVINLIAQGTIEHKMLDVLAFKKSVFAGVLDGGNDKVFMGESRLSRFMKEISEVTEKQTETIRATDEKENESTETQSVDGETVPEQKNGAPELSTTMDQQSLATLFKAGADILGALSSQLNNPRDDSKKGMDNYVRTEPDSGKPYLHIPLPDTDTVRKITEAAAPLLQLLGGMHK